MTTGQKLKHNLGLDKLKYVRINRVTGVSQKILFVWYDSYRSDMIPTNYRIKKFPWIATAIKGNEIMSGSNKGAIFSPLIDLVDYNGIVRNAIIIPVNLAGDRFMNKKQFSKVMESTEKTYRPIMQGKLFEFVTLFDIADKGNISDFTMAWKKDRSRVMGAENTLAKLIDCYIDEAGDSVTFAFLTESTELKGKERSKTIDSDYANYAGPKGEVDPETLAIKKNDSKLYEVQLKILKFFQWLDTFNGAEVTVKDMKEILEVSNAQVFSTSPAFMYQGMNFNLSQLDGSIYPTSIPNPVWGPRHGDPSGYFVSKELFSILQNIKFWLNPMSATLTKKLRDRGLI